MKRNSYLNKKYFPIQYDLDEIEFNVDNTYNKQLCYVNQPVAYKGMISSISFNKDKTIYLFINH